MAQANLFTTLSSTFAHTPLVGDLVPTPIEGAHFGILNLNAISAPLVEENLEIICTCDESGSMEYLCPDGGSKLSHLIHTLKNIARFIVPFDNVYFSVYAFNDKFRMIVERVKITEENLSEILSKFDNMYPHGCTDIELALRNVSEISQAILTSNPGHSVFNLFMTDGEATTGSHDKDVLKSLVLPDIYNSFIGFGTDHDSYLLNYLCNFDNRKSNYYFIEAIEKAGLVYGEILHGILYKYLDEVLIKIVNGLIYNYKTNQWVAQLFIGDLVGEANKNYHLVSNSPALCSIILEFKFRGERLCLAVEQIFDESFDFTKYIYRQRTLQLLYEAQEIQNKKFIQKSLPNSWFLNPPNMSQLDRDEVLQIKKVLREFLEELKKYMEENQLNNDKFLKNLCDDIYIAYQTFGTKFGTMFTAARQTSQGTQRCYTACQIPEEQSINLNIKDFDNDYGNYNAFTPRINRNFNAINFFDQSIDNYRMPPLEHCVSDHADTPYSTPSARQIMSEISCEPLDDVEVVLEEEIVLEEKSQESDVI
jgi:hypothetical protein